MGQRKENRNTGVFDSRPAGAGVSVDFRLLPT
jgi:hypothetical protein